MPDVPSSNRSPFVSTESPDRGPGICLQLIDLHSLHAPFRASRFVVAPSHSTKEDIHDVVELWTIASGHGKLLYDGGEYAVSEGDVLHFPSQKRHQVVNDADVPLVICSQWWEP